MPSVPGVECRRCNPSVGTESRPASAPGHGEQGGAGQKDSEGACGLLGSDAGSLC